LIQHLEDDQCRCQRQAVGDEDVDDKVVNEERGLTREFAIFYQSLLRYVAPNLDA